MDEIKNVHDKFFKKLFSKKENIKDFLKETFPQIEHKSYKDKKVILQLLSYMLKMWKQDMDNKHDLRVIIPLVFCQGRKKWDIPAKFRDNINLLTGIVLIKNVYYNNYSNLRYIFNLWAKTGPIGEKELIVFFTRYIVETEDIDAGRIEKLLKDKLKEEGVMPTLAQRWLEEGKLKGKLEGELLKQHEVVIKQLDKKFGLKEEEKEFILSVTDRKKLDHVIEEILSSKSKEKLLGYLR